MPPTGRVLTFCRAAPAERLAHTNPPLWGGLDNLRPAPFFFF